MTGLFIVLGLLVLTASLLAIAIGGNANLVRENRRLRAENTSLRRNVPVRSTLTLFTGGNDGGAA